jgi:hypothetical protein
MQNDDQPVTEERNEPISEMLQPRIPVPFVQGERRRQDRRQSDRQGKYDRRKNRCENCDHFQPNGAAPESGFCQHHGIIVMTSAFACPYFETVQSDR